MKYKLGQLIKQSENRNNEGLFTLDNVKGISIQKIFIETKAKMDGVSLKPYKVVGHDDFAYVTVTSRNSEKITIAHNTSDETYLVSSSYIVFRVIDKQILDPYYLYMYFNRPEFDRLARYNSWGSARETFTWDDMCDIRIELPPIDIQKKYVDIYKAMVDNQKAYEKGLDDLKLVSDATIENIRRNTESEPIGSYIEKTNTKNIGSEVKLVRGVDSSGNFIQTRAKMRGVNISNYSVVNIGDIAYNPSRINIGSIAISDKVCVVSPMYEVFRVSNKAKLNPKYLMMWLSRKETHRYTLFHAVGSVRDTFDFNLMKEYKIPIPKIDVQNYVANIYNAYITRSEINEKLKNQIKDICPILIAGSQKEV